MAKLSTGAGNKLFWTASILFHWRIIATCCCHALPVDRWLSIRHVSQAYKGPRNIQMTKEFLSFSKIPKFAEASDTWPDKEEIPWARTCLQEWDDVTEQVVLASSSQVTIHNDAPLWERILAHVLPPTASVTPASAYLAPKGGTDNLCNDSERYTDYCTFQVTENAEWLLVQTEEHKWKYRLLGEKTQ
jgi:hypothetical protein